LVPAKILQKTSGRPLRNCLEINVTHLSELFFCGTKPENARIPGYVSIFGLKYGEKQNGKCDVYFQTAPKNIEGTFVASAATIPAPSIMTKKCKDLEVDSIFHGKNSIFAELLRTVTDCLIF
jgi:hypothetical protein